MRLVRCTSCKSIKGEVDFYDNSAHKRGIDNICKACRKKVNDSVEAKAARARYKARLAGQKVPLKKRGRRFSE